MFPPVATRIPPSRAQAVALEIVDSRGAELNISAACLLEARLRPARDRSKST